MHKNIIKKSGISFIEVLVAMGIFVTLIVSGSVIIKNFSIEITEMQDILQSKILAKNAIKLTENILLNEDSTTWNSRLTYNMSGSPLARDFMLSWNGVKYDLTNSNEYDGPINPYSESSPIDTEFFRRITLTQLETWGLYEIKADVCFEKCEYHEYLYKIFKR